MARVTVITATYNRPDMLERAIYSVLNQTFTDFEYIIVNDNPKDKTREIVEAFNDERIVYIENKENPARTHCRPFNEALKVAKGKYITYLDDDNEYYPYKLEVSVKALDRNPNIDVVYCDMLIQSEDDTTPGIAIDFDPQFLINRNFIDTSEVMHKREMAFNVGGWNERIKRFTDWNLWVRMMKWGAKFQRIPIVALKYNAHGGDSQSNRTEVESWYDPVYQMTMFKPTFDPAGCYIFEDYLNEKEREKKPKVVVMTKTYGRLEYTKRMWKSLNDSTDYPFDWFVYDQGSSDGTKEWLEKQDVAVHYSKENVGISKADNRLLDMIGDDYDIIFHVDNDCEFLTKHCLNSLVDLWRRNHMLYMSPYPEGLVHNPGGAQRIGYAYVGPYMIEVTNHIGGFCAFIDARAYKDFRWQDQFKHGNQDMEASTEFRKRGYMPCYIPLHRVWHINTTEGQYKDYPEYFARRVKEKTEVA